MTPGNPIDTSTPAVDESRMRQDRLARAKEYIGRHGLAAALLFDPLNVRYATTLWMAPVWGMHFTYRWALVPAEGEPVLWDYTHNGAFEVAQQAFPDGDIRPAGWFLHFGAGERSRDGATAFAKEIVQELRVRGILGEKIGVDRLDTVAFLALQEEGVRVVDASPALGEARAVKTPDELVALREAARACDLGIAALRKELKPGVTENQLWGTLLGPAFANGAEYCDTRMLSSGPRTNPWNQEASDRVIEAGDLVAFDTDLAGRRGYFTDISRTYLCGDVSPTGEQRRLYGVAYEFVQANIAELRPGASFAELGERLGRRLPNEYFDQRYQFIVHGSGLADEFPTIVWSDNHEGEVQPGMVFSLEAYIGEAGGDEGVKYEEQIIVHEDGNEILSTAPLDERLL
jgi:Xaa-Pro dipeptidase